MNSVLFICHGNTCRSVIAEYLARAQYSDKIAAQSAGLRPGTLTDCEDAIYTLSQYKIDASVHCPRDIKEIDLKQFDVVVALDKKVAQSLSHRVEKQKLIVWDINDPYDPYESDMVRYRQCATMIAKSLRRLVESFQL